MKKLKAVIAAAVRSKIGRFALLKKLSSCPAGNRFMTDAAFRSEVTLHGGLVASLLYAALNIFFGILQYSLWLLSLAAYYLLLSAMRGLLVRYVHLKQPGQDRMAEYRRYRAVGYILLFMNQTLAGIVVCMLHQDRRFLYPEWLIYGTAAYTFYITANAAVNVVRFHRKNSPVLSAAKVISLTSALVSMLSLETVMITQFGPEQQKFLQIMTGAFGGGIYAAVLVMAIRMIVRANRSLKRG